MDTGHTTYIFSEHVSYQSAFTEELLRDNYYNAEGFIVAGNDKRARLSTTVHPLMQGKILFPKKGLDMLKTQLFGFGVEKHDDLADAFSMLVIKALSKDYGPDVISVRCIGLRPPILPNEGSGFPRFSIQFPS